jgi:hypothetical protein
MTEDQRVMIEQLRTELDQWRETEKHHAEELRTVWARNAELIEETDRLRLKLREQAVDIRDLLGLRQGNERLLAELAAKQARIDELMLEHDPEAMSEAQVKAWGEAQKPVAWQDVHTLCDLYHNKPAQVEVRPLYAAPVPSDQTEALKVCIAALLECGPCMEPDCKAPQSEAIAVAVEVATKAIAAGAAPAPAPSVPDVDALAQFIRKIDGNNCCGAGDLAERIVEWLAAAQEDAK